MDEQFLSLDGRDARTGCMPAADVGARIALGQARAKKGSEYRTRPPGVKTTAWAWGKSDGLGLG